MILVFISTSHSAFFNAFTIQALIPSLANAYIAAYASFLLASTIWYGRELRS